MCSRHNEIVQRRDKVAAKLDKMDGWIRHLSAMCTVVQGIVDEGIRRTAEHDTFTEEEAQAIYAMSHYLCRMDGTAEWDMDKLIRQYRHGGCKACCA